MLPPARIGFVSVLSTAAIHRLMRGALSYADLNPNVLIRDFRLPVDIAAQGKNAPALAALRRWQPTGLLTFLNDEEFDGMRDGLDQPPLPVVSMAGLARRPGLVVLGGAMDHLVEVATRHFRQQGLRSPGLLITDPNPEMQARCASTFIGAAKPADPALATHVELIDPELLADPDAPVESLPQGLARWLLRLPKPAGLMSVEQGGANYLVRACQALGLRVPEDVAVISVDDVDLCLSSMPTLTSVQPANEVIGFEAVKVLHGMIQGRFPAQQLLKIEAVDLHVRQSTGRQAAAVCDIAGAMDYINRYACQGLSVERLLVETQRVSKMTFHKHFVSAIGQTPGEAIRQRQFAEARRLLADTKLSITLVAEQCGFGSSSDFARAFRSVEGMPPGKYRQTAGRS